MRDLAISLFFVVPFFVAMSGCGSGDDGGPHRVRVDVTVTHNGSPVEAAHVTFVPNGEGQAAYGITDGKGVARLSTRGENDGAIPGDYRVMVRKTETETEGPEMEVASDDPGAMPANAASLGPAVTRNLLPEKYSAIGTTDLEATVADEGKNEFTFDLKD